MNTRLAFFAIVLSFCFTPVGHANMYNDWAQQKAVNLNGQIASEAAQNPAANPFSVPQVGDSHHGGANVGEVNPSVATQPSYDTLFQQAKDCFSKGRCATPQSAVLTGASQLYSDMECKGNIEGSYGVYYSKEQGYYLDQHDMYYGEHDVRPEHKNCDPRNSAPNTQTRFNDNGDPLVAHVHNHPVENSQEVSWPSVADVKGAITDGIDEYVVACSADIAKTPIKVLRVDCRTGRVYLISWPGSEEEFERPPQFDNVYDAQKVKSIEQLSDDDFYDPERFEELRDFVRGKNFSGAKRSVVLEKKMVSNRVDVANSTQSVVADSDVGVRGWCKCGANHGKRYVVGDMFGRYGKLECDLAYTLCGRCGYIVHSKDCADDGLQIMDVKLYNELKRQKSGRLAWHDAVKPLKARQAKIEAIPSGQIIVGGKCVCKEADPIKVGFTNREVGEFFVCCLCGRVREPDEKGDIPNGPTNLSEMGLDELSNKARERISRWLQSDKRSK